MLWINFDISPRFEFIFVTAKLWVWREIESWREQPWNRARWPIEPTNKGFSIHLFIYLLIIYSFNHYYYLFIYLFICLFYVLIFIHTPVYFFIYFYAPWFRSYLKFSLYIYIVSLFIYFSCVISYQGDFVIFRLARQMWMTSISSFFTNLKRSN